MKPAPRDDLLHIPSWFSGNASRRDHAAAWCGATQVRWASTPDEATCDPCKRRYAEAHDPSAGWHPDYQRRAKDIG